MRGTFVMVSLEMGRKKLTRSCATLSDWIGTTMLSFPGEESAWGHDRIIPTVLRSEDDVPHLAHDLVVGTSDLHPDDLVRPQAGCELVDPHQGLGILPATAALLGAAALKLWFACGDLLVSGLLVIVSQIAHGGAGEEFADVCQEALAIVMATVGPQSKSGVPQVAQVAHDLGIGRAAKVGLIHDCFFQLGVRNLALRHGCGDANRAQENGREENSRRFHISLRSCGRCRLSAR